RPSAHNTRNGPSEFTVTGSLKKWDIRPSLHHIKIPTLLLNGRYDEAQDEVVEPYFRAIGKVKWYRFAESSHTPHLEERKEFMEVVAGFLGLRPVHPLSAPILKGAVACAI
ncbi:MAG: hypothetical protein Q9207_008538, partial [Kuettlingeria erythrocarpa]